MNTRIIAWTPSAIDCFDINCVCSKCFVYYMYFKNSSDKCKMKDTVEELIEKIGLPENNEKIRKKYYL